MMLRATSQITPSSEFNKLRDIHRQPRPNRLIGGNTGQDRLGSVNITGRMSQRIIRAADKDITQQSDIAASMTALVACFIRDLTSFTPQRLKDDLRNHL